MPVSGLLTFIEQGSGEAASLLCLRKPQLLPISLPQLSLHCPPRRQGHRVILSAHAYTYTYAYTRHTPYAQEVNTT